jgi:hypothetical protein
MPTIRPLSPLEAGILTYLSGEALRGRGWLRRGVRGWRLYSEVKDEQQDAYIAERLPHLARLGLLDRLDVVEFGRTRATLLYRIAQEGERRLAALEGRPCEAIPPPEAEDRGGNLFVPAPTWSALLTLQRCARERIGPVRLGAHGWMSIGEIAVGQPTLRHDDLTWLVRRGLAELRKAPVGTEGAMRTLYRLTAPAMRAEALDAVPAPGGRVEMVETRVPDEAGPTPGPRPRLAPGSGSRRRPGAVGRP